MRAATTAMLSDLLKSAVLVWSAGRRHIVGLVVLSVALAIVPAGTLWISKLLVDEVTRAIANHAAGADGAFRRLAQLLALQVGVGALSTLLTLTHAAIRELLADRLQNGIGLRIIEKASSLEVGRFERAETHDALRNAYGEAGTRPLSVVLQVVAIGQAIITLTAVGTLMTRLGRDVVPLVLLATLPSVAVSIRLGAQTYHMMRRRAPEARFQNYLASLLTSEALVKEIRLFNFERYLLENWQRYYHRFREQFVTMLSRRMAWTVIASLLSTSLIALATLSVLRRAAEGTISVGDFSLLVLGIGQVQGQFSALLGSISGVYDNLLYMRNLFDFLEMPSRDLDAGETWRGPIERVEFDRVGFRYPATDCDVLGDVSFSVKRGESLALVGENGAGKTTVVKLLTRLYEPTAGRVLLNGMDASRFSPRSVQREISVILQDYGQYQMTARENIALSRLEALGDDAALETAAMKSAAAGFLRALPNGYDTMLGRQFSDGHQISGGQWQRLALGRMYFRPASVQIFDEPTAALDAAAEATTIERLQAHGAGRITVVISHRFSAVRHATQILVMEHGTVVERGSHAVLIANGGAYAGAFELQAKAYRAEAPRSSEA